MNFCMITTFYPPYNFGGDGIYVQALARELVRHGHQVTVVHCADAYALKAATPSTSARAPEDQAIEVVTLHSRWGRLSPVITQQTGHPWGKSRALRRVLARNFDVVNYHNISLVGGPAILALAAGGAKKVYTLHEHWLLCPTHVFWKNRSMPCDRPQCIRCSVRSGIPPQWWRYGTLIRRSLRHVDLLIAPSDFTAERHRAAFADGPPILVNPHFSRLPRREDNPARRDYFLYAGRITASKGIGHLLETFARHPERQLKIAGGGDLEASLRAAHAARPNIQFLGTVPSDRLADLYAGAIATLVPSLAPETFGLTVVESLACGTPAIVRNAGGCGEIVRTTGAGFIFEDFEELPALLSKIGDDHALQSDLQRRAREGVQRWYGAERHLNAYLQALGSLRQTPASVH